MKRRLPHFTALLLVAALAAPVGAGAAPDSSSVPQAETAKTKRCPKKSRAKRCRKPTPKPKPKPTTGPNAEATFRSALAGSRLSRVFSSSNGASSGSERFDFCDGTFSFYGEHSTSYTGSTTSYNGTWQVVQAQVAPDGNSGGARVAYTTDSADYPGGEVIIELRGEHEAWIDDVEYHRTADAAC